MRFASWKPRESRSPSLGIILYWLRVSDFGCSEKTEGAINNEKRALMPAAWLEKQYPDVSARQHYCDKHVFGAVPTNMNGFKDFHAGRRELLRAKLTEMLWTPATVIADAA